MQVGRVCGHVVSTLKHPALADRKLLLVELHDLRGRPTNRRTVAVDTVDAGPGDWVLVADEGASASQILSNPRGPVRTVVVGVVDAVSVAGFEPEVAASARPPSGAAAPGAGEPPPEPGS
jgi:ethanolamine utilization protein EutN